MRFIVWTVVCSLFSAALLGQTRKYSFQRLSEEEGLSQNFVYSLSQDERGFLWAGTGTGLSRYDGYEVKTFTTRDSLSADFVTADYQTSSGNLVFGHNQGGITLFDGLRFHPLVPDTLGNKVVAITEDGENNLWAATQSKGLLFIDEKSRIASRIFPAQLQDQIINVISASGGRLFVGTNDGLFIYRLEGGSLTPEPHELLPSYVSVTAMLPHVSDPALTWIGTAFNGIYVIKHSARNKVVVHNSFQLAELSTKTIQALAQDLDGDLWIGTRQSGVLHMNIGRDRKSVFKVKYFNKSAGIPVSSVNKLIVDKQGQIWVSTMGDGLVKIYRELFTYFPFRERFGVTEVRGIAETPAGYLVATDAGLLRITLNAQSDEYDVEGVDSFEGQSILSVYTDQQKQVWVGSEHKGVFVFTPDERIRSVVIDPQNPAVEIRLFEEDLQGNLWMSARGQGVYVLDRSGKPIRHLTTANRFIHNDIFAIKADSRGNIWFGAYAAGLTMMNKEGVLQLFSAQDSLRARDINDIDEDGEGNIWIATEGEGFFKYENKQFVRVGTSESMLSPFIKGIQYDPTGRIWFSYRKGLGYYDLKSEKKYHYTKLDGLLESEAYSSAIIVDSKANKWFCNDYGVTLFEHDTLADQDKSLQTYLTGIRIFFKDYADNLARDAGSNASMVTELPALTLGHEENHVTFDFVAIQLSRSGKIYYRHFLEGYDSEWTPPVTNHSVTYTNLNPGKYVFRIQATDDLGAWVDPVTEYAFVITPPYWKRTWFYLMQIASVVALFTLTYFIGKKGISTKRYVLRLMLFSSFFITLEYVENFVDPLVSDFFGGAPVFRFFLNFLLALLLLPVETLITHWLMDGEKKDVEVQPVTDADVPSEEVVEEENG